MSHPESATAEFAPPKEVNENVANPAPTSDPDDDFADVELGERQPEVCSMEEGCTSCQ